MTKKEWEELTLDEAIDWADYEYGVNELTSEDSLIRFAKEKIDEDNLFLAIHILGAIYNSEEAYNGYYLYDYSLGTISTPAPITCKEDLEDYVTFEEEKLMRDATNKILEMIDEGLLDARAVAQMCLKYMSEDAVADMADANEIFFEEEEVVDEDFDEEEPECPYVVFAGESCTEETSMSAWPTEESAIEAGKVILDSKSYKYVEVVYMPEDDLDTNEVIWWGERPSQS